MRPFDVLAAAEPAIDEVAAWQALQPSARSPQHRSHQATIRAAVVDIDRDHDQFAGRAGHLHIVGWTEAGIGHLHHSGLRIGGGSSWLLWLFAIAAFFVELLSFALDLVQRLL